MQHPDEGTIHSWLDGALPAEEAGRVESHVAECPECSTAVAEARGFIAASSRILTALDDIPRGVVPIAPARKRDLRVFWRAAAAMLVVAGGSLVVMREGGQEARLSSGTNEAVPFEAKASSATVGAEVGNGVGVGVPPPARASNVPVSAERDLSGKAAPRGVSGSSSGAVTRERVATDAAAPASAAMQPLATAAAAQSEVTPLKLLRVERTIGARRTIYEIAPSQTVTLTETESMQLSEVVVTGATVGNQRQSTASAARTAQPMSAKAAPTAASALPPMDLQSRGDSMTSSKDAAQAPKTSATQIQVDAAFVAPANTISWTESGTGKTLTLSGNLSVERLQEIRRRIERERASSSKKGP